MKNENNMGTGIRLIAGGYLIYLAVRLLYDIISEEIKQNNVQILSIIAAIAFILVGIWLIIPNIKTFFKKNRDDDSTKDIEANTKLENHNEEPESLDETNTTRNNIS